MDLPRFIIKISENKYKKIVQFHVYKEIKLRIKLFSFLKIYNCHQKSCEHLYFLRALKEDMTKEAKVTDVFMIYFSRLLS